MSDTLSETTAEVAVRGARASKQPADPGGAAKWSRHGVVIVLAGSGAGCGSPTLPRASAAAAVASDPTALATVTRQSLSSQTQVNATLGYAGSYSVVVPSVVEAARRVGHQARCEAVRRRPGGRDFTALPAAGQVVSQGQSLYSVNGSPGSPPLRRTPGLPDPVAGNDGADVRQLNADLVALGDATSSELDPQLRLLQRRDREPRWRSSRPDLGVAQTGSLALGQAVFLPTAAR